MKKIIPSLALFVLGVSSVALADIEFPTAPVPLRTAEKQLKIEILKPIAVRGGKFKGAEYRGSQTIFIQLGRPYRDDTNVALAVAGFKRTEPYCSFSYATNDYTKTTVDRELVAGSVSTLDLNEVVEYYDQKQERYVVSWARFSNSLKDVPDGDIKALMCWGADLTVDSLQNQLNWALGYKKTKVSIE